MKHGNLSYKTWQDFYYDGEDKIIEYEFIDSGWDTVESLHRDFMEDTYDNEILWLKNFAQSKYYREPYTSRKDNLVLV